MKKLTISLFFIGFLIGNPAAYAQGMMGQIYNTNFTTSQDIAETSKDEAKGKAIFEQLQSKRLECNKLTEDDFDTLGEYFMGQMMGNGHASMNAMMTQMMGEQGEKQMHVVMGKRLSGCDTAAALPSQYQNFSMPMMWSNIYRNSDYQPAGNMMKGFGTPNAPIITEWITLILFWTVLVLVIISLVQHIRKPKRK